jgi:hypothetical protein
LINDEPALGGITRLTPTLFVEINIVTQEAVDLRNRALQQVRRLL